MLLLAFGAAAAVMVIPLNSDSVALRWLKRCAVASILVIVGLEFAVVLRYLLYPSYLNHAEAADAAVSWLGWEGYPLYPRLDIGDVYGLQYGPAFYQVTGFFLWLFGPSIAASKIPGLIAFTLSQVVSFVTVRRTGAGVAETLAITGVQCLILAGFTDQGFVSGVRPDAFMFLASQTAVLIATYPPSIVTACTLGLLGGACANLKIHGGIYIFPGFVYFLCRSSGLGAGLRLGCVAGLTATVALTVPFISNSASPSEYYNYLQVLRQHPWNRWLFAQNIVFEVMCVAPLLLMYAFFTPRLSRAFKWFITVLALCMTMVTFPAAVSGAGPHHLLPFLPSVVWGFVIIRREVAINLRDVRARGRYEGLSLALIAAFIFGYGPIVTASWGAVLSRFTDTALVTQGIAEVNRAIDDNSGRSVAVGPGEASFDAHMLRVIPVFRGNPLPIDSTAWLDLEADGISDEVIRRAITECRVDFWLLPSNRPFVTLSHYHGRNIYSKAVLAEFFATYEKQLSGQVFDQWRCKRDDGAS